jgi:hypothetical protein
MIAREQAGRNYNMEYLESTVNDMLYYIYAAARSPLDPVRLPGALATVTPKNLTTREWALAITDGFTDLLVQFHNVNTYQVFLFYRANQTKYPPAITNAKGKQSPAPPAQLTPKDQGAKDLEDPLAPVKTAPKPKGVCANDIIRHYKAELKKGVDPVKCRAPCRRVHVARLPKSSDRAKVLATADKFCQPKLEAAAYTKLKAAITADIRYK